MHAHNKLRGRRRKVHFCGFLTNFFHFSLTISWRSWKYFHLHYLFIYKSLSCCCHPEPFSLLLGRMFLLLLFYFFHVFLMFVFICCARCGNFLWHIKDAWRKTFKWAFIIFKAFKVVLIDVRELFWAYSMRVFLKASSIIKCIKYKKALKISLKA